MSSPAASTSGDRKKPLEQITFRFCSECSNMLYPKEDEHEHKLMFTCRTCNFSEEATSTCIFRNILNNAAGETAGVTQDVGSDPTVGNPSSSSAPDTCTVACCLSCGRIITCEVCGDPFAMGPATGATPQVQNQEMMSFVEGEEVDIHPCEDMKDLAAYLAQTQGFFGDMMDEMEDGEMEPVSVGQDLTAPDLMDHIPTTPTIVSN